MGEINLMSQILLFLRWLSLASFANCTCSFCKPAGGNFSGSS